MNTNKTTTLSSYLISLAIRYKAFCLGLIIVSLVSQIFAIAVDYEIKEIIDSIALKEGSDIGLYIVLFTLYTLMHHGSFFVGRLIEIKYKPTMLAEVVTDMYKKTTSRSLHWFDSHLSGEISSKIIDFQEGIIDSTTWIYCSLCNMAALIIAIMFLGNINRWVVIYIIVSFLFYTAIMCILLKKQLLLQEDYVASKQKTIGIINDSVSNIFGIKIIGNVARDLKLKLLPAIMHWSNWDRKTRHYDAYFVDLTDTIILTFVAAGQIWLLAYLYQKGQITAGEFTFVALTFMSIQHQLGEMLQNILFNLNPKIAMIKASYAFINSPSDVLDADNALILPRVSGKIEYKNVAFSYGEGKSIFSEFNLDIKAGEHIGIVGTSGAGKTTLIKCLMRYFDIKSGSILIDGYDISTITQESLRENISVIPQDITMFHRSVFENLQMAKADCTLEEVQEACKKARIHDDIELMNQGYDTIVGERGVKMSGGQRQRIAIARAILKNAPILILDEATSALDTPTEHLIQESINEVLLANKATTIVIAHRLSTLLHMDRILVFEKGKIIQVGKHKELIKAEGAYKKLWEAQVGGFLA